MYNVGHMRLERYFKKPVAILFGYHDMGCAGLQSLLEAEYNVVAVFTHRNSDSEEIFFDSVAGQAEKLSIPVFFPDNVNESQCVELIKQLKPDYLFTLSYRQELTEEITQAATFGAHNIHASLLPAYRGRSHLNWVIINGEKHTGVTLHRVTRQKDAGPILAQAKVTIEKHDNALSLHKKLVQMTRARLPEWLRGLQQGTLIERIQDERLASCPGARQPDDGLINWKKSAIEIHNLIRGITYPWPGAYTMAGKKKLIIWESCIKESFSESQPGTIISLDPLLIACGVGVLEVKRGMCGEVRDSEAGAIVRELKAHCGMLLV